MPDLSFLADSNLKDTSAIPIPRAKSKTNMHQKISLRAGLLFSLGILMMCFACTPDGHEKGWQPLDLLPHGVAVSVMAPPDAQVQQGKIESVLLKDLTILGGDNYNVQLFYSPAITNDIAKLKNDQLQIVRDNRYFAKVVKEEVAGFIYQTMIDTIPSYGFNFVKLQGDLELNFQSGMNQLFTQEEAEVMYVAGKVLY